MNGLCEVNKADAYIGELLIFITLKFKINLDHKLLSLVMGSQIFKEGSKLKLTEKRKTRYRDTY